MPASSSATSSAFQAQHFGRLTYLSEFWHLGSFIFSFVVTAPRINPVAFPSPQAAPAPYSQLASPAPARRRSGASKQNVRLAASCDRASPHHDRERAPGLGSPMMRKLITTTALPALVDNDQRHLPRLLTMQEHKTARIAKEQQSSASIALLGHYDSRPASGGSRFTTIHADLVSLTWLSG
jgi:hypothetical protein